MTPRLRGYATSLRARGCEVDLAPTGEHALRCVAEHLPNVVLCDLGLPDMDGIELIRAMRVSSSSLPIIVLSVRDTETDRAAAFDAGADGYLPKPFGMDELLAQIRAALPT